MTKAVKKPIKKKKPTTVAEISDQLPQKYLRALELIEMGELTDKEICKATSIPIDEYRKLVDGSRYDNLIGDLFTAKMKEIQNRTSERVRFLAKDCTKLALLKVSQHLRVIQADDLGDDNLRKLIAVVNALGKTMPKIDIGQLNVQNNNFTGLTPFELNNEYQRLTNVARSLSRTRRLRDVTEGRAGEIPDSVGAGSSVSEE